MNDLSDAALQALAERAGSVLYAKRHRLAVAESCTGGWLAKCLTDIPGSSQWFECGYVTYSNSAKAQMLGVAASVIETFGAVSQPTAEQMASGALHYSGAELALAITGVAGPDGGTPEKPVGLVWFALARRDGPVDVLPRNLSTQRETFKYMASQIALDLLRRALIG